MSHRIVHLAVPGQSGAERMEVRAVEHDLLGICGVEDRLSRLRELLGRVLDRQRPFDLPPRLVEHRTTRLRGRGKVIRCGGCAPATLATIHGGIGNRN